MERVKQTFAYEVDIIASPINPIAAIQRGATLYGEFPLTPPSSPVPLSPIPP